MRVTEVMTKNPACCWPSSSALTAATIMQQKDVGILPVIQDPFTTRLVGVVTDRDLCLHVVAGGRDPAYIWISECMTGDPVCCSVEDDVGHALGKLRFQPPLQLLHERPATLLMKLPALFRLQATLTRLGIVAIYLAQHLQSIATFVGKVRRHFHELSSSMGEAVRQQNLPRHKVAVLRSTSHCWAMAWSDSPAAAANTRRQRRTTWGVPKADSH